MLYGSLNNWKCASAYFSMHRSIRFVVHFSFSHDCNHFYMSIWSTVYMRKYVLYWTRRQKKKQRRSKCLALVPVVSNTFCEELVMVHDDVHTAISKRILWNISSRWYVHSPYNREKGHFEIQLAIRRFTSHYQCHLCAFCFDVCSVWCVCLSFLCKALNGLVLYPSIFVV